MVEVSAEEHARMQSRIRELECAAVEHKRTEEALEAAHAFQQSIISVY